VGIIENSWREVMLCVKQVKPNPPILYKMINNKQDDLQADLIIIKKINYDIHLYILQLPIQYSRFMILIDKIDFCHDSKYFPHKTIRSINIRAHIILLCT